MCVGQERKQQVPSASYRNGQDYEINHKIQPTLCRVCDTINAVILAVISTVCLSYTSLVHLFETIDFIVYKRNLFQTVIINCL